MACSTFVDFCTTSSPSKSEDMVEEVLADRLEDEGLVSDPSVAPVSVSPAEEGSSSMDFKSLHLRWTMPQFTV